MIIRNFGDNTPPENVTEAEWKFHLHGVGKNLVLLERVSATIFRLRLSNEMFYRFGTEEELLPYLFSALRVSVAYNPHVSGNVPVKVLRPSKSPNLSPGQLNDLLKGL